MSTRYSGKNLYAVWIHSAGTITLSTDYRTLSVSETADEIDATAGADARKVYLGGPVDASWTFEYLDPVGGGTANWAVLVPQAEGTLQWSPEGTASGKPKHSAAAIILGREPSFGYGDVTTVRLNGRLTAAPAVTSW